MKSILLIALLPIWTIYAAEVMSLQSFPGNYPENPSFISKALGESPPTESSVDNCPWPTGSIFTLQLIPSNAFPISATKPAGRHEQSKPTPAFLNAKRLFTGGSRGNICGYGSGDGFIDEIIFTFGAPSQWNSFERDLLPFHDSHWSWDGTTCMALFSDLKIHHTDGSAAWELPAEITNSINNNKEKDWIVSNSWPQNDTWMKFLPGAITNNQVSFLSLSNQETIEGARTNELSWITSTINGIKKIIYTQSSDPLMPVAAVVNDLHINRDSWTWNTGGGLSVISYKNTTTLFKIPFVTKLRTLLVANETWTWKEKFLEQALLTRTARYKNGFIINQILTESQRANNQIVVIDGNKYPYRATTKHMTRIDVVNEFGQPHKSWSLPGPWVISGIKLRGENILLESHSDRSGDAKIYCIFNPDSGRIAPKTVFKIREGVMDAIWIGEKVSFFTPMEQYMRNTWLGDTEIVGSGL